MGPGEGMDLPPVSHGGTAPKQEPGVAARAQLKHSCPERQETEAQASRTPQGADAASPAPWGARAELGAARGQREIPSITSPAGAQPGAGSPSPARFPGQKEPQRRVAVINLPQRPAINLAER